jgi:hypothetical protein
MRLSVGLFWLILFLFIGWDFSMSKEVDSRNEPPFIAFGSGAAPTGAHCALPPN